MRRKIYKFGNFFAVAWILAASINGWMATVKLWPEGVGADYKLYVHAAIGDWEWQHRIHDINKTPEKNRKETIWLYNDSLSMLWKPFARMGDSGMILWMACMHIFYLLLVWRALHVEYGWLAVVATQKPFFINLVSGNISPLLAFLLTTVMGSYVVGIFKPYLAPIAFVLSGVRAYRKRKIKTGRGRHTNMGIASVHSPSSKGV